MKEHSLAYTLMILLSLCLLSAARAGTRGYPYAASPVDTNSPWGFYIRECTSFAAWKMNSLGAYFNNNMSGGHFGNAGNWASNARAIGLTVNCSAAVHAIAEFSYGHVAVVRQVFCDGTIEIEEYNGIAPYAYSTRTVSAASVSNYIHIIDAPGGCTGGGGGTDDCAGKANGLYCGGDSIVGDPNTLYRCSGGHKSIAQVCSWGCVVMPAGTSDYCW